MFLLQVAWTALNLWSILIFFRLNAFIPCVVHRLRYAPNHPLDLLSIQHPVLFLIAHFLDSGQLVRYLIIVLPLMCLDSCIINSSFIFVHALVLPHVHPSLLYLRVKHL